MGATQALTPRRGRLETWVLCFGLVAAVTLTAESGSRRLTVDVSFEATAF